MNYIVTKKQLRVLTENINSNIFESTLDDQDKNELYQYGITYLGGPDEKNCEKLIQDGKLLEKAVEEGKLKMEPEDIKEFKTNLNKLKTGSVVPGCRVIKPIIIKKFQEGFESNYKKAKINLCWFAENINKIELNACKVVSTQNQQAPQPSVPDSTTVKPSVPDSTTVKPSVPDSTTVKPTTPVSNSTAPIVKRVVRRF